MDEYLKFMEVRLEECKRVLKDTGSIFVHCDRMHYRLRCIQVNLDLIYPVHHPYYIGGYSSPDD